MAETLDELPEPAAVKEWLFDEQATWAEEYGETLWEMHGDDEVVAEMDAEELKADRKKAWEVVYGENENRITHDVSTVTSDSSRQDELIRNIEQGFKQAHSN